MRNGWISLHALFFLLATALPGWPQASEPSAKPNELVTTYLILAAGGAGIVREITANLAEKREIDRKLSELDAAAKRKQEITEMSAFCQGTFSKEEVARRRKICEDKQKELDESNAAANKLRAEIKQRDKERQAEALKLKTAYDGLGQRAKAIEPAIAQHAVLKPLFDQCRAQSDLMARAQCLADRWAAAAPPAIAREQQIIVRPLTPGSATPGLLSGTPDYEKKITEFKARKADVYSRLNEISRLRNECRDRLPACSETGRAYDEHEAIRRRDLQYSIWGEASYYIPLSDSLTDVPPELKRDIGTWGGIKFFGYGGDQLWIWLKEDVANFGSTPPGGGAAAKRGWQKAHDDNQGFKP